MTYAEAVLLMNFLLRSVLLLSLSLCATASAAEPVKLPSKEKLHLYLLIGQSNMAGRGVVEAQDKVPHPRILMFTKESDWALATDPLHFDKSVAGVGLGSSFARVMAEASPAATIGLIPCAVGGTPLARWLKGGDLYQQALGRARLGLKDGTLKGILWHQGEGDSGNENLASSYGERLAKMVADLRADLGAGEIPFVAGKLGGFLKRADKSGKPSHWPLVNEQIAALPKSVPNTASVESTGLNHKGDTLHFDSPSLREFGKRYADAMKKLHAKPEK